MAAFQKKLEVLLVSNNSANKTKRKAQLILAVNFHQASSTLPAPKEELVLELSQPEDPLFLFVLRLGEKEFRELKAEQNLLVDFSDFPEMLRRLLDAAREQDEKSYVLHFLDDGEWGQLEVVEQNPFKYLAHLSLRFPKPTDQQLKKHLLHRMHSLQQKLVEAEKLTKEQEKRLLIKNSELQKMNEVVKQKDEEMKELGQIHNQELKDLEGRLGHEAEHLAKDSEEMQKRLEESCQENQDLRDQLEATESLLDREKQRNGRLEREAETLEDRLTDTQRELQEMPELRRELEDLEAELDARDADLGVGRAKFEAMKQRKMKLEEELEWAEGELEKALDIIRKFMAKNKQSSENEQKWAEKEKRMKELEKRLEEMEERLKAEKKEKESAVGKMGELTRELAEAVEKNSGALAEAQRKDNLIHYLNGQLADLKLRSPPQNLWNPPLTQNYRPVLGLANRPASSSPSAGLGHLFATVPNFSPIPVQKENENADVPGPNIPKI